MNFTAEWQALVLNVVGTLNQLPTPFAGVISETQLINNPNLLGTYAAILGLTVSSGLSKLLSASIH